MSIFNRLIIVVITLLCTSALYSQDTIVSQDLELWPSVKLSKKWDNGFGLSIEQELRLGHNASELNKYFTQVGLEYEINKHIELGGAYRFIKDKNKDDEFEKAHRLITDVTFSQKIYGIGTSFRIRYQNQDDNFLASSDGDKPTNDIRLRLKLKYKIKPLKISPYLSSEIYRTYEKGESSTFSKIRYTTGADYSMKKIGKINLFYRIQKELNVDEPETRFIIGLGYSYNF